MNKSQLGKKSRQAGLRFERRVRQDLESKGWIVTKWQNNIDLDKNKIVPAKMGRFRTNQGGFPDFVCFKQVTSKRYKLLKTTYELIFVESKISKYLSKEEKEKVNWLKENGFKIFVAYKEPGHRIKIKYKEL